MGLEDLEALLDEGEARGAEDQAGSWPLVLVVLDDEHMLAALGGALSKHYRVTLRASAAEALASWDPEISAVILDVKMRDHDGSWACDEIKKKNPHLPVIFYAAYPDVLDPSDLIHEHQPFGYITQGTDTGALRRMLDHAIRYDQVIAENKKVVAELQQIRARMQQLETSIK